MDSQHIIIRCFADTRNVTRRSTNVSSSAEVFEYLQKDLSLAEPLHANIVTIYFSKNMYSNTFRNHYYLHADEDGFLMIPVDGSAPLRIERYFDEDAFLKGIERKAAVDNAVSSFKSLFKRK